MAYKTPGVYVEEETSFPPSVAEVETAIPAFIGYTKKAEEKGKDLTNQPKRIKSLLEYELLFGGPARPKTLTVRFDATKTPSSVTLEHNYQLYYALWLFFDNGGGDCYIVSVGSYDGAGTMTKVDMEVGIEAINNDNGPTLILFPDAALMGGNDLTEVQKKALLQCAEVHDLFAVFDLDESGGYRAGVMALRNNIGNSNLKYGAAYTPHLHTSIPVQFIYQDLRLEQGGAATDLATVTAAAGIDVTAVNAIETAVTNGDPQDRIDSLANELKNTNPIYASIVTAIQQAGMVLPPSSAIVGVYARVDRDRGVWKAPVNVSLSSVIAPTESIDDGDQESLNVDMNAGKSINAIRNFAGRGTQIWGARTLAGNDNEWRYIPVRRFFNMVEASVRQATAWVVFEPNAPTLWIKTRSMIENYLIQKWRAGALMGATPEEAFFVKIGLDESMTAQDILEGRMIVEIGMAAVRPAEFSILKFSYQMQAS